MGKGNTEITYTIATYTNPMTGIWLGFCSYFLSNVYSAVHAAYSSVTTAYLGVKGGTWKVEVFIECIKSKLYDLCLCNIALDISMCLILEYTTQSPSCTIT